MDRSYSLSEGLTQFSLKFLYHSQYAFDIYRFDLVTMAMSTVEIATGEGRYIWMSIKLMPTFLPVFDLKPQIRKDF